ncbi:hypothetical protein MUP56_02505 [Patescibacteria group bacterium]|nr:hypothetical protein [Patescibacteria group bacterium]
MTLSEWYPCDSCNGTGKIIEDELPEDPTIGVSKICPVCNGKGKIDWVENEPNYEEE